MINERIGMMILLDGRGNRLYYPGETLAGSYRFDAVGGDDIKALEVSVLWATEGKGNTDFGIHAFWRLETAAGDWIDPRKPGRFSTILPASPLSYPGVIVKVNWYVRIRLFLADDSQVCEELPFRLGHLPDVRTLKYSLES